MAQPKLAIRIAADVAGLKANMAEGRAVVDALGPSVAKMAATWAQHGAAVIQNAHNITAALQGVSAGTLTAADAAKNLKALDTAMAQLAASGKPIPLLMVSTANALRQVEQPASKVGGFLSDMGKQIVATAAGFVSAQAVLGAVSSAFRTLAGFVTDSVKAYAEADAAQIKLTAALRAQHTLAPQLTADYNAMASEFQRTTVHGDDTINMMQALLVQVGGVMPSAMKGALEAAANLSAGLGIDLETATKLVAKAAAGHTETLGKYGIVVSESALKTQGFDAVLTAINRQFGGQASAELETYAGQVQQIANNWNNVQEAVGKIVLTNAFTTASLRLLTEAAGHLDEQSGETSVSVADLVESLNLPIEPQIIRGFERYLTMLNLIADTSARMARMPSPFAQNAKDMLQPVIDISGAMRTWDIEIKENKEALKAAAAAAKKHAEELKALKEKQDAARVAMLAGVEGTKDLTIKTLSLGDALGLAGGSKGVVPALRDLERFTLRATSDVKSLGISVDDLGRRGVFGAAVLGDLNKQFLLLPNVVPGGTKAIKDATTAVTDQERHVRSLSDTLGDMADDFVQLAQVSGDTWGGFARDIGIAIKTADIFLKQLDQMNASMGGKSGGGAGSGMGLWAASIIPVIGWVIALFAALNELYRAMDDSLEKAERFRDSLRLMQEFKTTTQFSKMLSDSIYDLSLSLAAGGKDFKVWFEEMVKAGKAAEAFFAVLEARKAAEALKAVDIIRELGGASQLTAAQIAKIKVETIPRLLDMIAKGGPLANLAMQQLLGLMEELNATVPSLADVTEAAERLGIDIKDLGSAIDQLRINEMATQAAKDFDTLQRAGIPLVDIFAKLGPAAKKSFQDMAAAALKSGLTIPESMRGVLQALLDSGELVDENGEALKDLSRFDFAKPLEKMVEDLIKALDRLIAKFLEVPTTIGPTTTLNGDLGVDDGGPQAAGGDYLVTRPTVFLAGEAGAERVSFSGATKASMTRGSSGAAVSVVIQAWDGASVDRWLQHGGDRKLAEALTKVAA